MLHKPKVLITTGLGINSHEELGYIFKITGAEVEFVHANELINNPKLLNQYQGLALAGGFSMGDQLGAGQSLANRIANSDLRDKLEEKLADKAYPIIGICNHLQVLAKLNLLPEKIGTQSNDSGKHETGSWDLAVNPDCDTVWLKYLKDYEGPIFAPISHGEGRIVLSRDSLANVLKNYTAALAYITGKMAEYYKSSRQRFNPNGSTDNLAGFGWDNNLVLFPHFERFIYNNQRDDWADVKLGKTPAKYKADTPDGLFEPTYLLFKAAVDCMK